MSDSSKRTPLSDLGEFKLIEHLTAPASINNPSTQRGIGDDAAVIDPQGKQLLVSTDLLMEGIHFDLTYVPLKHLGYKAIVVNLSDIYAMNAHPKQVTVSLGISKRFCLEDLERLYAGIYLACERYGVDLVGGDTTSSLTGLTISVTAIGEANSSDICHRNSAKENDLICVSGNFGGAYIGLQLLEREKKVFLESKAQPKLEGYEYVLERFLKPEAQKGTVETLANEGIKPTAMIDVSDGLSSELLHICKESEVGCRVYLNKIPIAKDTQQFAQELGLDPLVIALNGGEDYELLFTAPLEMHEKLEAAEGITVIGHVTKQNTGAYLVTPDEKEIQITAQGWNSLKEE